MAYTPLALCKAIHLFMASTSLPCVRPLPQSIKGAEPHRVGYIHKKTRDEANLVCDSGSDDMCSDI